MSREAAERDADISLWINARINEFREKYQEVVGDREVTQWTNHPDVAYLNRLKRELKNLPDVVSKNLSEIQREVTRPILGIGLMFFRHDIKSIVLSHKNLAEELLDQYLLRIDTVAAGDLESEKNVLEGMAERLKIQLSDSDERLPNLEPLLIPILKNWTTEIRLRLNNCERDIREVKTVKMPEFYRDFNVSKETARASKDDLNDIKDKKKIVDEMNPKEKPESPPQPTKREALKKREEELFENLALIKERREKLIALETKGMPFEQCSSDVQRRVKQIENMMDNQEQLISDEMSKIYTSL